MSSAGEGASAASILSIGNRFCFDRGIGLISGESDAGDFFLQQTLNVME